MITNREEVIDKAFKVFLRMNYEKASISTLAKACGVVKTGVVYYFPHKLDLFMAVADKYVIQMQTPANKFAGPTETLAEFIEQYVAGVSTAMNRIIKQVRFCADDNECCPNFYYFHFLSQVRMYYPGAREKMEEIFRKEHELWKAVFTRTAVALTVFMAIAVLAQIHPAKKAVMHRRRSISVLMMQLLAQTV